MFEEARKLLETTIPTSVGKPFLANPAAKEFEFNKENFSPINTEASFSVAGVDSGSVTVFSAPGVSVGFVRTFYNVFKNLQRLRQEKKDFLVVTKLVPKGGEAFLESVVLPFQESELPLKEHLVLNASDSSLVLKGFRAMPSAMTPVVRKYLEWIACKQASKHADLVVKDGSLATSATNESFYAKQFFEADCKKSALSKTCSLVTDTGLSLTSAVNKLSPKGKWVYSRVYENQKEDFDFFVVKLHDNARHCFRFEYLKNQDCLNNSLSNLAQYSRDSGFLGYPYVLVDADNNGRVSRKEADVINSLLQSSLLSDELLSLNAHDELDLV
ncbi:hypothetical protein HUU53_00380 [Candidatus Micrarchaeota archaeon]|nr:hypothetical protein [Candidatus Micrarchaeota archaeon]